MSHSYLTQLTPLALAFAADDEAYRWQATVRIAGSRGIRSSHLQKCLSSARDPGAYMAMLEFTADSEVKSQAQTDLITFAVPDCAPDSHKHSPQTSRETSLGCVAAHWISGAGMED